jgi:hypothetical protein
MLVKSLIIICLLVTTNCEAASVIGSIKFTNYSTNRQLEINGKALQSTTVNGHALLSNVTVTASDAGAIPLVGNAIVNSGTNMVYRCTGITNTGILTVNSAMCTTGFVTTSLKLD